MAFVLSIATAGLAPAGPIEEAVRNAAANDPAMIALVKGLIARESAWNPGALRYEPHINDASYGLMQVLLGTARLFDPGVTPADLFVPGVNVSIGTAYLQDQLARYGGDVAKAVSAYNAGRAITANAGYVADVLAYRDYYLTQLVPAGDVVGADPGGVGTGGQGDGAAEESDTWGWPAIAVGAAAVVAMVGLWEW